MSDELKPPGLHPVLELGVEVISVFVVRQQLDYVLSFSSGDGLAPFVLAIYACRSIEVFVFLLLGLHSSQKEAYCSGLILSFID